MAIGGMTEAELEAKIAHTLRRPGVAIPPVTFLAKVKDGTPADSDFPRNPPDGTVVVDTAADKIWARTNGVWKSTALA